VENPQKNPLVAVIECFTHCLVRSVGTFHGPGSQPAANSEVSIILTVAFAAFIVYLMKGPAYVWDPLDVTDSDKPAK